MSRISRLVVLVTSVAALVGAMAGTASAVTWDVTGPGVFHATAGAVTLSSTGGNFVCPSSTATGTYPTGSIVSPVYNVTGTLTVSGCLLAGQSTELTCGYNLTATTQPIVTAVTTGTLDLTCGVTLSSNGLKLCHIEGSTHAIYRKNVSPTLDTLTLTTTSTLRTTGSNCLLLGSNDLAHLSETTYTFTSPGGPHIVRTA
ncbi:hypothetical protein [Baekduia sp. Peel2402]|uniref:hypothetical protein n=1 Tax=Baekduia sp. Peel2402 TaxID=3458296 RepID=UPI00403E6824